MFETISICFSSLIAIGGVLFFLDRHITMTNKWKADLLAYFEGRVSTELMTFSKTNAEAIAIAMTKVDGFYKDNEKINTNFETIQAELFALKSQRNMQSGIMQRFNPTNQPV